MAAFRLASKGQSINEVSYETERESILALLNMQIPSLNSQQKKFDIQPDNYVSIKYAKKYKTKQVSEFYLLFINGQIKSNFSLGVYSIEYLIVRI